ncbi:APC family permease [Mycoplasma leonicaptivi]|uniref:APC family permease n=1 Tax=Mycoplasma leonicaptivi TaxID=36742 RepID=UPI000A0301A9|nr:amino acid permease [Mycoplasma leonicaptivi]
MEIQKARKIGLILTLMMLIGSVVGIGIFFKNGSVLRSTDSNGLSWLLTWIIGGIISLCAALSFMEIGSFKNSKITSISNWSYKIFGKHFGYFTNITYTLFYFGMLFTIISFYFSEIFLFFISSVSKFELTTIPLYVHVLIGLITSIIFFFLNVMSTKVSGIFQSVVTLIKFIPILGALFIGIIFPNTHNAGGVNAFSLGSFTFKGIVLALPSVLFAYDAFLVSGSLAHKVKKPTKTIPKAIIIGMTFITILYTLIALSSILHNKGTLQDLLKDSLSENTQVWLGNTIAFFLVISTIGVVNGLSAAFVSELSNSINANLIFGSKQLIKKIGEFKTLILYAFLITMFWAIVCYIPTIVLDTDILTDAYTNYPTVFFFVIYAIVILKYTISRKKQTETTKFSNYLFYTASLIAVIGIIFVSGANIVVQISTAFSDKTNPAGWGLFLGKDSDIIPPYLPILLTTIFAIFFISLPYLNEYLNRLIFKESIIKNFDVLVKKEV